MPKAEIKTNCANDAIEDEDNEKKRKRTEVSSVSSTLDTSTGNCQIGEKQKKKKKKKGKQSSNENIDDIVKIIESQSLVKINKQLKDINLKLSNVMTKDDGSLRDIIRETFSQMKEDLLSSVNKRIDILECKLFDKEVENENLKTEITKLETDIENQKEENDKIKKEMQSKIKQSEGRMNDYEQYSRITNIRVDGIVESKNETQFQTERKVVNTLNKYMPKLRLKINDIEIGHRLGKPQDDGTPRQIIVKFFSRSTKKEILMRKKLLKGSRIYINEDLTRTNQYVLNCIRKKLPDEVDAAWSKDGNLFYKSKTGSIHRVRFQDYQTWIDLPWPAPPTPVNKTNNRYIKQGSAWLDPVDKSSHSKSED